MTKKYFTELAKYNNWTDSMAMEWLNQINDEQWEQTIESSFNSIRKTATHMVSAKKSGLTSGERLPIPFTCLPYLKAQKMN